jgi:hypothetical protein
MCVGLGLGIAVLLSGLAALGTALGQLSGDSPPGRHGPGTETWSAFFLVMSAAYFLAGLLGGLMYYELQHRAHRYSGKLVLSFFFGLFGLGSIGLSNTLAFQHFGLNFFNARTVAEGWADLPMISVAGAAIAALVGPVVWMAMSGQKEIRW